MKCRPGNVGIYGFDIISDRSNKLWLLEVNKCPTMEMTTTVTQKLVPEFMRALVNVLLDGNTLGFTELVSEMSSI